MNVQHLERLLKDLHAGQTTPQEVLEQLRHLPYQNLNFARVDHHRPLRTGLPEVIFCQGKTPAQILGIIRELDAKGHDILATRMEAAVHGGLRDSLPAEAEYHPAARILVLQKTKPQGHGCVMVVTAGTADIPVAEEAAITAATLGNNVERIFDVGVAGLHRILDQLENLRRARVIIAVAGMDGVLASVMGGLVDRPVIGVPTSVGYGAAFGGVAPLLTMLNSCAAGVGVVNIDNGFGAACLANKINRLDGP
ncbi:MAG: nickel pincer cofactor biosynthesis protein LarB [Nitrospinaceae bacterium]